MLLALVLAMGPDSIDAFIDARLSAAGLKAAPPADRATLLRRVTFDLIGLPPTPEEVDAFVSDGDYEKVVDRLLADPRHGERWARHWLDVVRYAESDGFENDKVRPHAWRYRDYVVRSLNADKPYDRFVAEQIAGDQLFTGDPDALVATGFARLGPWDYLCKNEAARWQDYLNDATDTVGSAFLGLTVGCARCHDHKYDPITMADYYGLQAFFAGARRESHKLPDDAYAPRRAVQETKLAALRIRLSEIPESDKKARGEMERLIKLQETETKFWRPAADGLIEGGAPPTHILKRGELTSPGPEVVPAFIGGAVADLSQGRRAALARWLTDPSHPLVARVIVNRLWMHHFGRGIVATPSDFGKNGRPASHPELLDWLARELVRGGWRLKPIHRLMVTSAAYRRSSRGTGDNTLLARMNRRRLEAEALRDAILAVSGRLNPAMGGPGVYVPISREIDTDLPNNDKLPSWGGATEEDGRRRTLYVFQRRSLTLPLVEAFDGADMNHRG